MRLDIYLARQNYAESRTKAEKMIHAGNVFVDGLNIKKPSSEIDENSEHEIRVVNRDKYVSRGGLKLEAALDRFNVDVKGMRLIDVGASTGGFCDCLLQRGADRITAVDSGKGQLHPRLCGDERILLLEEYNARFLNREDVGIFDGAVMDVSFISQTLIIPSLFEVIREGGFLISLIKPQFEAGVNAVGKNGIVKHASDREFAVDRVVNFATDHGFCLLGVMKSPISGGNGNIEYLGYFVKSRDYSGITKDYINIRQLCRE